MKLIDKSVIHHVWYDCYLCVYHVCSYQFLKHLFLQCQDIFNQFVVLLQFIILLYMKGYVLFTYL